MQWLWRELRVAHVLCIALCMSTCYLAGSSTACADRYALLVGCTRYPHLDRAVALYGPANDVVLLRSVLQSRFGFTDSQITVLAEAAGDAAHRPTRANIEREFRRLAKIVAKGDQVVILMAGHGSQQPDDDPDNPADPEPDGVDEVFCAADVAQLKPGRGNVIPGAISDDELRRWLAAITAQGANVWIIVDACHSGTMTRGSGQQVVRRIPAQLLAPQAALAASRGVGRRARGIETAHDKLTQLNPRPADGRLVALFASQPDELTVETRIPKRGRDSKWYGLLTFTLAKVLAETNGPLTYRDLAQRIQRRYIQSGRTFPTPFVEGPLMDSEVLGLREQPTRPALTIAALDDSVRPLNLAVDVLADGSQDGARERAELKLQLRALTESQASLLEVVDSVEQADWLVRKRAGQVTLVPAEGWAGSSGMAASGEFGPAPASGFEDWLSNRLQRIARARNLLAVALAESHNQEHGRKQVDVEVTLLRMKDSTDRVGTPVNWQANGRVVREGEIIGFQVHNQSRMARAK